jgi:hypothetical protein
MDFCLRQSANCRRQAHDQADSELRFELMFYATELEERARRLALKQVLSAFEASVLI